jgi:V/A-type H+-transporting ATPase subunit I
MAIEKLNLISISGSPEDFSETLLKCVSEPEFHMDDAGELLAPDSSRNHESFVRSEGNPFTSIIADLEAIAGEAGISIPATPSKCKWVPTDEKERVKFVAQAEAEAAEWQRELNVLTEEKTKLSDTIREDKMILDQMNHLKDAQVNLDRIFSCQFFRFRFGYMPRESYENLSIYTSDIDDMFFFASSVEKREVWGLYFMPHSKAKRIDALFESLHFQRVRISDRTHGTPAEAALQLEKEINDQTSKLEEIDKKLAYLSAEIAPKLIEMMHTLKKLDLMIDLQKKVMHVKYGFIIAGYITQKRTEDFKKELEKASSVKCTVEKASCSGGLMPPTKLKNPSFLGGFEDFVKMYGLPSYNEIDPTPLVAITYVLFFGMMFGDVGQGAVIILVGALMWFLKKLSLGKVLMTVGVSSMLFGVFYGSIFGMEEIIHGFKPNENINTVLFGTVGVGMLMIVVVILVNIINGIRQKNIEKIFFSQNGLPGLIMYIGAVLIVLVMLNFVKFELPLAVIIPIIAAALLVIFLREPLVKLVEGRKDFIPESKLDFILENFFELFEVVLSFLTNTISFIRIGAFALSHVGMMSVVFLLAETADGYNPVILILGNLFVIGFEGMIVCIQVLRLEFYELFGRFFEGDGRPFEPAGEISKR